METLDEACEVMHDAYEIAALGAGWETNPASRKPWDEVPDANKATMRAAVSALLAALADQWGDSQRPVFSPAYVKAHLRALAANCDPTPWEYQDGERWTHPSTTDDEWPKFNPRDEYEQDQAKYAPLPSDAGSES